MNNNGKRISKMSDAEWLAHLQSVGAEKRHRIMVLDITDHLKSIKKGNPSYTFERKYRLLKEYMRRHRWDKEFILKNFGVTYKELTAAYFASVGS